MILNQADDVRIGSADAACVYLGEELIWTRNKPATALQKIFRDAVAYIGDGGGVAPDPAMAIWCVQAAYCYAYANTDDPVAMAVSDNTKYFAGFTYIEGSDPTEYCFGCGYVNHDALFARAHVKGTDRDITANCFCNTPAQYRYMRVYSGSYQGAEGNFYIARYSDFIAGGFNDWNTTVCEEYTPDWLFIGNTRNRSVALTQTRPSDGLIQLMGCGLEINGYLHSLALTGDFDADMAVIYADLAARFPDDIDDYWTAV